MLRVLQSSIYIVPFSNALYNAFHVHPSAGRHIHHIAQVYLVYYPFYFYHPHSKYFITTHARKPYSNAQLHSITDNAE